MSKATNPNTQRKHKDAVDAYTKLSSKTKQFNGVKIKIHSEEYCIAEAAHSHYMAPRTLEDILYSKHHF